MQLKKIAKCFDNCTTSRKGKNKYSVKISRLYKNFSLNRNKKKKQNRYFGNVHFNPHPSFIEKTTREITF